MAYGGLSKWKVDSTICFAAAVYLRNGRYMDRTSTFKTTFIFTFHNTSHVVKRELVVSIRVDPDAYLPILKELCCNILAEGAKVRVTLGTFNFSRLIPPCTKLLLR